MQTSTSVLRAAAVADLPAIIALDQAIFGEYGAAEDPAVIRARLTVFPGGCVVLVAPTASAESDPLLGYLTTEKWDKAREPALDEDPWITHKPAGLVLNITTLAVGQSYQGRGYGEQLLHAAIEIARRERCTQIILETARAERFYLRHGFTKIGERQQRGILLHIMGLMLDKT